MYFCEQHVFRPELLAQLVSIFYQCALRPNTHSTYGSLVQSYFQLCVRAAVDPSQPLDSNTLSVICILYSLDHKITSLPVFTSAVASYYRDQGWTFPDSPKYRLVIRGIKNYFAHLSAPTPRVAITMDDLLAFHHALDLNRFAHARDWCSYLFAFFGLLRVGEFTNGSLRLKDDHCHFHPQLDHSYLIPHFVFLVPSLPVCLWFSWLFD